MRFVTIFLSLFVGLGLLVVTGYLGWDWGRLLIAVYGVQNDMARVVRIAKIATNEHKEYCFKAWQADIINTDKGLPENDLVKGYQLRFVNSSTYKIELVCNTLRGDTLELKSSVLWGGVVKKSGSGMMALKADDRGLGVTDSVVVLEATKTRLAVGTVNGAVKTWWRGVSTEVELLTDKGPKTTCEGFGGACCNDFFQVGSSSAYLRATNCSTNCFGVCRTRPALVYFNTNPLLDPNTREVVLSLGQTVAFGYDIAGMPEININGYIDFGDGTQKALVKAQDIVEHAYGCETSECVYAASLFAWDEWGVALNDGRLNSVNIRVRR